MKNDKWNFPPHCVVWLVAAITIGASFFANYMFFNHDNTVDPRVTMDFAETAEKRSTQRAQRNSVITVMEGEVSRTAERISEATALAIAASLCAAREQINSNTLQSAGDLLTKLQAQNLLPPGLMLTPHTATLSSNRGNLFLRYRSQPLGIEVVAIGRDTVNGPPIIVRVPDEATGNSASLFIATRLDTAVPAAFAPTAEIIATGWSPEPLRSLR